MLLGKRINFLHINFTIYTEVTTSSNFWIALVRLLEFTASSKRSAFHFVLIAVSLEQGNELILYSVRKINLVRPFVLHGKTSAVCWGYKTSITAANFLGCWLPLHFLRGKYSLYIAVLVALAVRPEFFVGTVVFGIGFFQLTDFKVSQWSISFIFALRALLVACKWNDRIWISWPIIETTKHLFLRISPSSFL